MWLVSIPYYSLLRVALCIYGSSMSFHDLIAHFLSTSNNIPVFGCIIVWLSIHLLKNDLVASNLAIMNKAAIYICGQDFVVNVSFQLTWVNIEECGSLIVLCDKSTFSFIRSNQLAFYSRFLSLHSHQQCMRLLLLLILISIWCQWFGG